jgi:inhibitor of Bruton tyrosine kinase
MYAPNIITKVTSGGNTICAVSSMGDVFSFSLPDSKTQLKPNELAKSIRAQRIWSLRRRHMAVRDVAVGQDGTVIISTESGSVWTRVRRAKPKISKGEGPKEYKFARVGNLTRIVAVRANNAGAYAAIRNDVDLKDIDVEQSSLEDDLITTIPLYDVTNSLKGHNDTNMDSSDSEEMVEMDVKENSLESDGPWAELFLDLPPASETCDLVFIVRDDHRIYLHKAMLACRSSAFRDFLTNPSMTEFSVKIVDGVTEVHMEDVGIVAVAQLVHYLYTDQLIDLPEEKDSHKTERLEMIKELRTLGTKFRLKALSDVLQSSWYIVLRPEPSLRKDLRNLQDLSPGIVAQDAILCLSDGEVGCHSFVLAARCPFFEAMLDSAGLGGGWVASRRQAAISEGSSEFKIQLKHLSYTTMSLVLEHIYCDAGEELFQRIKKETSEEFLEFVIEVMAVANELLLDRLKDVCQSVLSKFGRA